MSAHLFLSAFFEFLASLPWQLYAAFAAGLGCAALVAGLLLRACSYRLILHLGDGITVCERHAGDCKLELLPLPPRAGYRFVGWFADEGCTEPVVGTFRVPRRGAELYARWKAELPRGARQLRPPLRATRLAEGDAPVSAPAPAQGASAPAAQMPASAAHSAASAVPSAATAAQMPVSAAPARAVRQGPAPRSATFIPAPPFAPPSPEQEGEGDGAFSRALLTSAAGEMIFLRLRRSFLARIALADEGVRALFATVRAQLLTFRGVRERVSWGGARYYCGRTLLARVAANTKSLAVSLAADPQEAARAGVHFRDLSDRKRFAAVPVRCKVTGERSLRAALSLVRAIAERQGLQGGATVQPFTFPPADRAQLTARGLIRTDARRAEVGHERVEQARLAARVVANVYRAVARVAHAARLRLGRADERQSGGKLRAGHGRLDVGLNADAVLDEQHERVRPRHGGEQPGQQAVVGGLQPHQNDVAHGHVGRAAVDVRPVDGERPAERVDVKPVLKHIIIVTVQQEVHL